MTGDDMERQLLIQAGVDGELTPAEAARAGDGGNTQAELAALSQRLKGASYFAAPDSLRAAVHARIAAAAPASGRQDRPVPRAATRVRSLFLFGSGFALAACLALVFTASDLLPSGSGNIPEMAVEAHIRALQPGHLMDVVSTDQHTVKPWFDGRLDFAPPVKDLAAEGFPLVGGRLDYLVGRSAAALVYQRRQHVIDLFVRPDGGRPGGSAGARLNGYNFLRWDRDGMLFWAVSDISPEELADFVRLWKSK